MFIVLAICEFFNRELMVRYIDDMLENKCDRYLISPCLRVVDERRPSFEMMGEERVGWRVDGVRDLEVDRNSIPDRHRSAITPNPRVTLSLP